MIPTYEYVPIKTSKSTNQIYVSIEFQLHINSDVSSNINKAIAPCIESTNE